MKFHGQNDEDRIAYHYFQRFPEGSLRKTYLDVGAFDGVDLSNTLLFENLGWQGICVEANSEVFPRLRANRRCVCLNVACSDREEMVEFFSEDRVAPLGTIGREAAEKINAAGRWSVDAKQTIQAMTVDQILAGYEMPEIDFVSIDVDGSEIAVLRGFDLQRARPKLICIETNLAMVKKGRWPRSHADEIDGIITAAGYHLMTSNGCNSFYCREKLTALDRFVLGWKGIASRIGGRLGRSASGQV